MHTKTTLYLTNLSKLSIFRPLSNLERREGFKEDYFVQVDKIHTLGKAALGDDSIPKDELEKIRIIHAAASYHCDFVKKYQSGQLENTVNLFASEINGEKEIAELLKLQDDKECGDCACSILSAIYTMHGMVLKNQGKKNEAKQAFEQGQKHVKVNSMEAAIIQINAASLLEESLEKKFVQEAVNTVSSLETALASVYVVQAQSLAKTNDRTVDNVEKINTLYSKAKQLFPSSNIVRNNWALYLCDEDEFDPFARSKLELKKAAELLKETISVDQERTLIVAPTYLAVTYFKLAAHEAKGDIKKASHYHVRCMDTLEKCRGIIDKDELLEFNKEKFQYNKEYRASKHAHFLKIEQALMKLGVGPAPIVSLYKHAVMPTISVLTSEVAEVLENPPKVVINV